MTTDLHRMYAIGVMAFIIFLSSLVSLPILPQLSTQLGAQTYQIPIVVSAALATVVVAQFFAGALADRYSRQRLILIGTLLGSISSLLCLLAAEMIAAGSGENIGHLSGLLKNMSGIATPQATLCGALFRDDAILLIKTKESNTWMLPGEMSSFY